MGITYRGQSGSMQAGKQLDKQVTSRLRIHRRPQSCTPKIIKNLQTMNSFNHLAVCLNMLRTVSSIWLGRCFRNPKRSKSISSLGAGTASSHYMGLAQVHWSHSLTCRIKLKTQTLLLHTAAYCHLIIIYPPNLHAGRN